MSFKIIIFVSLSISLSSAALFVWSNHEIVISPFEDFTTKSFLNIVEKLDKPDVFVFKSPKPISNNIMSLVEGFYSIYSPNGAVETENVIDLTGNPEIDLNIIKETATKSKNFISTIIIPTASTKRSKREIYTTDEEIEEAEREHKKDQLKEKADREAVEGKQRIDEGEVEQESSTPRTAAKKPLPSQKPTGAVIYKAKKKTDNIYALLYATKPLIFRKNDSESSDIFLGNVDDDMIIYDSRLNVNIPINGRGKITLRFNFTRQNGYWYMLSVKITDTQSNTDYNLVTKDEIFAPARFSYHCNGETKFSGNGTELIIYDLQVQCDSRNGKFGDANDCVPFTTAPIWSGIFITIILGVGLIIALIAIMDIKTMDKFDNYKTKNLPITVSE